MVYFNRRIPSNRKSKRGIGTQMLPEYNLPWFTPVVTSPKYFSRTKSSKDFLLHRNARKDRCGAPTSCGLYRWRAHLFHILEVILSVKVCVEGLGGNMARLQLLD